MPEKTQKNLWQRIAAVMKDIQYINKDSAIKFGSTNYKTLSEEKVTVTVRASLIKNGLVIVPVKQEHIREGTYTAVNVLYRLQNIDKPEEFIEIASSGTGMDQQDKGVGKAMSYAYKYLLLRTFAIPSGDDPDKICNDELASQQDKVDPKTSGGSELAKKVHQKVTEKEKEHNACIICGTVISENVRDFSQKIYKEQLCMACQDKKKKEKR